MTQVSHFRIAAVALAAAGTAHLAAACGSDTADDAKVIAADSRPEDATVDGPRSDSTAPTDDAVDAFDLDTTPDRDVPRGSETPTPQSQTVQVNVTLDGVPSPGTLVVQGGVAGEWITDGDGQVLVEVDLSVVGDLFLMASHPEARIAGQSVWAGDTEAVSIALVRFDTSDNPDYLFKDPGEPGNSPIIQKCSHCHMSIAESWGDSAHRYATSNPILHDVYEGTSVGVTQQVDCDLRGGQWITDIHPSTGEPRGRCKTSAGVVDFSTTGGCADCHAPGIDGQVGGRDLREAKGRSFDYGAHCDVCHRVESVDLAKPAGVAGALNILRPSEPAPFAGVGDFHPLTFCPNHDNANLYMSCVQRDHFKEARFCGGCHELDQAVLDPQAQIDLERWPDGTLPIHSTLTEWSESIYADAVSCQGCHMPDAPPEILNGADIQMHHPGSVGIAGGWHRPHGSVHLHTFAGPKSPMDVRLPSPVGAAIDAAFTAEGHIEAKVTVSNNSAGHAVPTGDPLRAMFVHVKAFCGDQALLAIGGDVINDVGGTLAMKAADEDWSVWPDAKEGQILRVTRRTGAFHDYSGFGPFGGGTEEVEADNVHFSAADKGLPVEHVVGSVTITSIADGIVTTSAPIPEGDLVYLGDEEALAGEPGFAFARVTVNRTGARLVHHYEAVDIASDNRLLPLQSWTSRHLFTATCDAPIIRAEVVSRPLPLHLSRARGWTPRDETLATAERTLEP